MLPTLVEAPAGGISGSNLTVLNGSQGVKEMAVGVVAQGLSIFDTLRKGLATSGPLGVGAHKADDPRAAADGHDSQEARKANS